MVKAEVYFMRCHYCGNELDSGTKVCPYCDRPIDSSKPKGEVPVYDTNKVFTLEDWKMRKTAEMREDAKTRDKELEEHVESKKKKMDETGQDSAFRDAGVKVPKPESKKSSKNESGIPGPEMEKLLNVLTKDKKKEVKDKLKKDK